MSLPDLSIVIPTLDESGSLPDTLERVRQYWPGAEVIVVDGGSRDETVALARSQGARVIELAQTSRGIQLQTGASEARAGWLLFLHADTRIPAESVPVANAFRESGNGRLAMFQIRFDKPTWLLRFSSWCSRFDSVFTRFGDQGILITRQYYEELGGFRPWPLFEDVDLIRRARVRGRVHVLDATVVTSARRFRHRGTLRQQLKNASLLLRYLAGADPVDLARNYRAVREAPPRS